MIRRGSRSAAIALFVVVLIAPGPAWAHGEGETTEGYLLVQQALGHLAHDAGPDGIDLAMEKVKDALDTTDHAGVDVAEVQRAMSALEAGDGRQARDLLEDSIKQALHELPPATGNQTGTRLVVPELSGRPDMRTQDWAFLTVSILLLAIGVWLAYVFRPVDSLRSLRERLAGVSTARTGASPSDAEGGDGQ